MNQTKISRAEELVEAKAKIDMWKIAQHKAGKAEYPEEVEKLNKINEEIKELKEKGEFHY